jgi:hypothetical protein
MANKQRVKRFSVLIDQYLTISPISAKATVAKDVYDANKSGENIW